MLRETEVERSHDEEEMDLLGRDLDDLQAILTSDYYKLNERDEEQLVITFSWIENSFLQKQEIIKHSNHKTNPKYLFFLTRTDSVKFSY